MSLSGILLDMGLVDYRARLEEEAVDLEALTLLCAADLRSVIGLPLGHAAKIIDRARNAMASSAPDQQCMPTDKASVQRLEHVIGGTCEKQNGLNLDDFRIGFQEDTETTECTTKRSEGHFEGGDSALQPERSVECAGSAKDFVTQNGRARLRYRSGFSAWWAAVAKSIRLASPLDLIMIGDHQWSFKLCLMCAQSDEALKGHFLLTFEIWTIVYTVFLGALIDLWSNRPNAGHAVELICYEILIQSCTLMTMMTVFLLAVLLIVTSSVHPSNIKAFVLGIGGALQYAELLVHLAGYSTIASILYAGWLRIRALAPGSWWAPLIVPIISFVLVALFVCGAHSATKLVMHAGLMCKNTSTFSEADIGERFEDRVFGRVWAQALSNPSTEQALLYNLRCARITPSRSNSGSVPPKVIPRSSPLASARRHVLQL